MPEFGPLGPLLAALRDLVTWCEAEGVPAVIIGGVAASIHGQPRTTKDIDALVLLDDARRAAFLDAGQRVGFVPRLPDALAFAERSRVLLVHHTPSGIDVDVSFGSLPFEEEAISRGERRVVGEVSIPLVRADDLVAMKAVAHRARDLVDISAVVEANPRLDWSRIRGIVREFAQVLEMPEILEDLERLLPSQRSRSGKRTARKRTRSKRR